MQATIVINLCSGLDELATELAEKVSVRANNNANLLTSAKEQIAKADYSTLIFDTLLPVLTSHAFLQPAAQDAIVPETAFSLLLILVRSLPDADYGKISKAIATGSNSSEIRAKFFTQLYNSTSLAAQRYTVFKHCIESVGEKSALTENLTASKVHALLSEWKSSREEVRALFLSIADAVKDEDKAQQALLAYLATFPASAEGADFQRIKTAAVNAVREKPSANSRFVLSNGMQRLQKEDATLYRLVQIVSGGGSLDEYVEFTQKNAQFEQGLGLNNQVTMEKMRLLALASLGTQQLTYAQVAKALQIEEKEVERWVIHAIGTGVVDARLDQVNSTVTVSQTSAFKPFVQDDWKQLSSKLNAWRNSIRSARQTTEQQQQASTVVVE